MLFPIARDGARLLLHMPGADPMELAADSQMNFRLVKGGFLGATFTFVRDAQGQATGLVLNYMVSGTAFSVPMPRIDASAAQTIVTNNEVRLRSQTPHRGAKRRYGDYLMDCARATPIMTRWLRGSRISSMKQRLLMRFLFVGAPCNLLRSVRSTRSGATRTQSVRRVGSRRGLFGSTRTASFRTHGTTG
jgi:hypothetical protein